MTEVQNKTIDTSVADDASLMVDSARSAHQHLSGRSKETDFMQVPQGDQFERRPEIENKGKVQL